MDVGRWLPGAPTRLTVLVLELSAWRGWGVGVGLVLSGLPAGGSGVPGHKGAVESRAAAWLCELYSASAAAPPPPAHTGLTIVRVPLHCHQLDRASARHLSDLGVLCSGASRHGQDLGRKGRAVLPVLFCQDRPNNTYSTQDLF